MSETPKETDDTNDAKVIPFPGVEVEKVTEPVAPAEKPELITEIPEHLQPRPVGNLRAVPHLITSDEVPRSDPPEVSEEAAAAAQRIITPDDIPR